MSTVPHQPAFNASPLFVLAAAFALGVLLAGVSLTPPAPWLAALASATLAAVYAFSRGRLAGASVLTALAFACAGAALAAAEGRAGAHRLRRLYEEGVVESGDPVELTGVLERAPETAPDGLLLELRAESLRHKATGHEASGRVGLFAPARDGRARAEYASLELRRGARVRVTVALGRAGGFRNPGVVPYDEQLERRDLEARGTVKSPLLIERLDDERVFVPLALLDAWRARLVELLDRTFSAETAGVLKASALGNRHGLSRDLSERFREGGTFHVLVISGLHITFIGGVAWAAARRLTRRRAWQWAASAFVVWCYALAVGAEAPVVRAALMFTVVALAPALGRRSGTLNALGGAALILLVRRPRDLFDPSFQLTFISVLAIVGLAWPLLASLKAVGEWRPTSATPRPPACPRWWLALGETLYWSERDWRREMARSAHGYNLFKTAAAARLERRRAQAPLRYAFAALLVSACVQLALLPLLVLYFHRLSLASLVLNVFVGVLMAALTSAALAALLLGQLWAGLGGQLVRVAEAANWLMAHSVDPFAGARLASVRLPEYAGAAAVVYALYFAPLLVLAHALARWKPLAGAAPRDPAEGSGGRALLVRVAAAAQAALFAVVVLHPFSAWPRDGRLRVDFLDVGQGDAALLTMPDGTTLLVDGGGRPRFGQQARGDPEEGAGAPFERDARGVGEAVVSEYLWWRGLDQVNYVLATHAHADHVEGLGDVARNFRVDAALVGRAPGEDAEYARFAAAAARAGVPVYLVGRGDRMRFGAVTAEVLWPARAEEGGASGSGNEDSVVLRVSYGRRVILLTGDVEGGAESALVAAHGKELGCDVVKVAHHGSRTSSSEAFVGATRPRLAVIPVGLDSPYGHPHPSVVARWRAHGAEVLSTGKSGAVTVSTDGEDLRVETYVGGRGPAADN